MVAARRDILPDWHAEARAEFERGASLTRNALERELLRGRARALAWAREQLDLSRESRAVCSNRPHDAQSGTLGAGPGAMSRDRRRFGPGPYLLGLHRTEETWPSGWPFDVPAVAAIDGLRLDAPVTLLAGDNGAGKSTLVEAIAAAMGFAEQGGELERSGERPAVPRPVFGGALRPVLSGTKTSRGYSLRAESFFNLASWIGGEDPHAPDLSLYGDVGLHAQSHGESFLALAANRFGGDGFYVLDEPEAALSATGALALLAIVARAAADGAQFVIATHSPILLALPGARIYEADADGLAERAYDDLEAVRLTRGFLAAPERYLRAALGEEPEQTA